jgi:hypothetical protein
MLTLMIVYIASGILLVLLSIPLLLEKVPPNPVYGFRISPALDDPRIWYATNKHSAKRLMCAGLSVVIAAVGLYFVPSITLDVYALSCLAVFAVVATVGLVQSIKYMNALAQRREKA